MIYKQNQPFFLRGSYGYGLKPIAATQRTQQVIAGSDSFPKDPENFTIKAGKTHHQKP
jgi:hypothetical protein